MVIEWKRLAVLGLALLMVVGVPAAWGWARDLGGPSSYDDCLLKEMRGLPANAATVAIGVCGDRFPLPVADASWTRDQIIKAAIERAGRKLQAEKIRD